MVTTIQLKEDVKMVLNRMKTTSNETYEDVIVRVVNDVEKQKKMQEDLLIEGHKEMAEESLRIIKEFEYADSELDVEW
ncbi:hypothetical protein K8R33_04350 [archaeon]|nr:hypothetical protein [archaeon]